GVQKGKKGGGKGGTANTELLRRRLMDEKDSKAKDAYFFDLAERISANLRQVNLVYQRPTVQADNRFFGDLTQFAPGLHTTWADIYAIAEAEAAPEKRPQPGTIDESARKLIDKARSGGWQTLA